VYFDPDVKSCLYHNGQKNIKNMDMTDLNQEVKLVLVLLDPCAIPEKGPVELKIDRPFDIKVTAEEARRQVNRWLLTEVSYLMRALPPILIVGEQVVWQVPASFGLPQLGQIGTIGTIEVDIKSGKMETTRQAKADLERKAEELAARMLPYRPRQTTPSEYLAKNVPPAPKLPLTETVRQGLDT
jgi:hypothetical protein